MANQINIQVGADIKNLQEGIKTAVSTLEKGGKDMNAISESVSNTGAKSFTTYRQAVNQTSKDVEKLAMSLGIENEATKQAIETHNKYVTKLSELRGVMASSVDSRPIQQASAKFNMLGHSLNQVTREMPAFANSMQTGFMAISNNVPMLFDEISRLTRANKELAASGQPTQSVFKQIAGAVFSLQTALSLGVTVLTVYGAEIFNLTRALFDNEEAIKRVQQNIDKMTITTANNAAGMKLWLDTYSKTLGGETLSLFQARENKEKRFQEIVKQSQAILAEEAKTGVKNIIGRNMVYASLLQNTKAYSKELTDIANKEKERNKIKASENVRFELPTTEIDSKNIGLQAISNVDLLKQKLLELKPIGTDAFVALGGEVNKLGVFFDELGDKIGGWANMATNALAGVGVAFGQALMTGDFDEAAKSIVRQLGNIAVQIGAAMIAIGIPQAAVGLPSGFGYIAGGTALTIVGGAMMASGVAPNSKNSGGGGNDSIGSSMPAFTPDFAASSQYLMLDSRVRGTDIIISADNQRRQNRRIR